MKLDSKYVDCFSEYPGYFGRSARVLKYVYEMTNSGKLFADELKYWLIEAGFIQSQCHMSIYYKYAKYGTKTVVLSYVDGCVYCYTYEAIGKWFVETPRKRFHVNVLGFAYWFMSIRI